MDTVADFLAFGWTWSGVVAGCIPVEYCASQPPPKCSLDEAAVKTKKHQPQSAETFAYGRRTASRKLLSKSGQERRGQNKNRTGIGISLWAQHEF